MCGSNIWAITQTLAGTRMAGRWTGFQNFIGNLAGVTAPAVTGFVIDYTGRFFIAFVIMAGVGPLGALFFIFFFCPVEGGGRGGCAGKGAHERVGPSSWRTPIFFLEVTP